MLGYGDRLTVLNPIDDRAGLVLEFPDADGCSLHSGHILAQSGHKALLVRRWPLEARYPELMTAKERLHRLIDDLSNQEAEVAFMLIERQRAADDESPDS